MHFEPILDYMQSSIGSGATWERNQHLKQIEGELKAKAKVLTCSFAGAAAAAEGEGVVAAVEASTSLLLFSILVNALEAAPADSGAPDVFSFGFSSPVLTDLEDPDLGFFAGGASSAPSSSLKSKRFIIIDIKESIG